MYRGRFTWPGSIEHTGTRSIPSEDANSPSSRPFTDPSKRRIPSNIESHFQKVHRACHESIHHRDAFERTQELRESTCTRSLEPFDGDNHCFCQYDCGIPPLPSWCC